jgi:hypothetical protein
MTEVVYSIDSYSIELKKITNCEPYFISIIPHSILIVTALIWLPILLIGDAIIGDHFLADGCGVRVILKRGSESIKSKNCPLSNNPDKDAVGIQKLVDEYIKFINNEIESEKVKMQKDKEYNEQCCNRFKDVIKKVKVQ